MGTENPEKQFLDYRLRKIALACGFTHINELKPETLKPRLEVRDACSEDKCKSYNKSWSCPPACGSLEDCEKKLALYSQGLLLQTTGKLEDSLDYESMERIGKDHNKNVNLFSFSLTEFRKQGNNILVLGSGPCTRCNPCKYPDAPCCCGESMIISMEAFGLVVSDVCKANNMAYYHGPNTISFTGCVLF